MVPELVAQEESYVQFLVGGVRISLNGGVAQQVVIPESGDQLVLPTHSETMTPATQIQSVPSTAIKIARHNVISLEERKAIATRAKAPQTTAE